MTTTLERSLSRNSSMSMPLSSPRLSLKREPTPPAMSDPSLSSIHDRLNILDSRVLDLRSAVLTKDGYVDRRNREDEHLRREFDAHRSISMRIDLNVVALRTDVDQLRSGVFQLKSSIGQSDNGAEFLRSDLDRLQKNVDQVQADLDHLQTEVSVCRVEISKLLTVISQLRTDMITLQHETSRLLIDRLSPIETRMMHLETRVAHSESRMKHSERVRFNSLVFTTHAPITPVPVVDEDSSLRFPEYFPRTVWRFWCLKKRSRIHRLVELAEFYQLEGYQCWSRMHQADTLFGAGGDSDSSDSSEFASSLTLAEAVRQYPEAAHQALAATLGLVYYKIRKEVGDGPNPHLPPRPPKRQQEEVVSNTSSTNQKPVKIARRPNNISPTTLHKLITGPSLESKSQTSNESDKLGWNHRSEVSDDTMSKLRGIVSDEVGTLLRALEQGRLKLKPSRSERLNISPTEAKASFRNKRARSEASQDDEVRTLPNTVPTEIVSPSSRGTEQNSLPDTVSGSE